MKSVQFDGSISEISAYLTLLRSERDAIGEESLAIREELTLWLNRFFNSGVTEDETEDEASAVREDEKIGVTDEMKDFLQELSPVFDRVQQLREGLKRYEERLANLESFASSCYVASDSLFVADAVDSVFVSTRSLKRSTGMIRDNISFSSFLDDAHNGIIQGWRGMASGIESVRNGVKSLSSTNFNIASREQAKTLIRELQTANTRIEEVIGQMKIYLTLTDKLKVLAKRVSQDGSKAFRSRLEVSRRTISDTISEIEQYRDEVQMRIVNLRCEWKLFDTKLEDL